ncbi:hypothetical protein PSYMO_37177, partial [Pseudomonas amygdali pv. mori str. 301020]
DRAHLQRSMEAHNRIVEALAARMINAGRSRPARPMLR